MNETWYERNPAWDNFTHANVGRTWEELAKFGGKNLPGTPYVEFENEADGIFFLLKWS
jgi:hypothetical protein